MEITPLIITGFRKGSPLSQIVFKGGRSEDIRGTNKILKPYGFHLQRNPRRGVLKKAIS